MAGLYDAGRPPQTSGDHRIILATLLGTLVLVIFAVFMVREDLLGLDGPGASTVPAAVERPGVYPHPECAAVMQWLRQNTEDRAALEIIAWGRPGQPTETGTPIDVRFRARNSAGAPQLFHRRFFVRGEQVIGAPLDLD